MRSSNMACFLRAAAGPPGQAAKPWRKARDGGIAAALGQQPICGGEQFHAQGRLKSIDGGRRVLKAGT